MDTTIINSGAAASTPPPNEGKWEKVDAKALGIDVSGAKPNEQFVGPDGSVYCVAQASPQLASIYGAQQTAVPTPSNIIQMPPIVQPIALVPYATQNQPMLQYDPYATPFDVKQPVNPARYVKKPYKALSVWLLLFLLVGAVALAVLAVAEGMFKSTGIDMVNSLISTLNKGESGTYFIAKIQPFISDIGASFREDWLSTTVTLGIPAASVLILVFSIVLIIKYLIKIFNSDTPRCFSALAFTNVVLCIAVIAGLYSLSRGESAETGFVNFLTMESVVHPGFGIYAALLCSVIALVFPFFARKNAYILEAPDSKKVYIIK